MSISINCCMVAGNLTRDPELKYTPAGTAVCNFNLAVNESWTDKKTGEKKEDVSFIEVVAFGRTAELAAEYLKKGVPAMVEGKLKQDRWESTEGKKMSKTKVTANRVHFLGRKSDSQDAPAADPAPSDEGVPY